MRRPFLAIVVLLLGCGQVMHAWRTSVVPGDQVALVILKTGDTVDFREPGNTAVVNPQDHTLVGIDRGLHYHAIPLDSIARFNLLRGHVADVGFESRAHSDSSYATALLLFGGVLVLIYLLATSRGWIG